MAREMVAAARFALAVFSRWVPDLQSSVFTIRRTLPLKWHGTSVLPRLGWFWRPACTAGALRKMAAKDGLAPSAFRFRDGCTAIVLLGY